MPQSESLLHLFRHNRLYCKYLLNPIYYIGLFKKFKYSMLINSENYSFQKKLQEVIEREEREGRPVNREETTEERRQRLQFQQRMDIEDNDIIIQGSQTTRVSRKQVRIYFHFLLFFLKVTFLKYLLANNSSKRLPSAYEGFDCKSVHAYRVKVIFLHNVFLKISLHLKKHHRYSFLCLASIFVVFQIIISFFFF